MIQNNSYKYSQKRYNHLLRVLGCIRVGTLHDFRKSEHPLGIFDSNEGKKQVSHHVENLFIENSNDPKNLNNLDYKSLSEFNAIKIENSRDITIENVTLTKRFNHTNLFILCTSKIKSLETMKQFDGADSCLEIVNPLLFYQELTRAINYIIPSRFLGSYEVTYQDRHEPWNGMDWGKHPALIKEPKYQKQFEIRALWQPLNQNAQIEPIIIGNFKLGQYVKDIVI